MDDDGHVWPAASGLKVLDEITPLILTFNEGPNIGRTLKKLEWAHEIVVVDSFSTDDTLDILRRFPNVRVVQRIFDAHTEQWNFGLGQIRTPWVLTLDADYVMSDELNSELVHLDLNSKTDGYSVAFKYCVFGQALRGSLYPRRTVLFRRAHAVYRKDGHTQLIEVNGPIDALRNVIYHDDRKSLDRWLKEQTRYMAAESRLLVETPRSQLSAADRIRIKVLIAPILVLLHTLFVKRLILDGWRGWYYVLQRTYAEVLLSLSLLDLKIRKQVDRSTSDSVEMKQEG